MKNFSLLCLFSFVFLLLIVTVVHCKKDSTSTSNQSSSFTEEFEDFTTLSTKGWATSNYANAYDTLSLISLWGQGLDGVDKTGVWYGFCAYSYSSSPDEFAYSVVTDSSFSTSAFLITPVLSIKNGDQISFYTCGDTIGIHTDRMQVLMEQSTSADSGDSLTSVGNFTSVLFDINADQTPGGYPTTWKKYEHTFSGISGQIEIRIAFRHFVVNPSNAKGVGIDQFRFQSN